MIDQNVLCEKIRVLHPDIGECGLNIRAEYDDAQKAWVIYLKQGHHELKRFLDDDDAEKCMIGKKCVGLGIEIARLKGNIERLPTDR